MRLPLAVVWDNDPGVRARVGDVLAASGFEPLPVAAPHEALELLRSRDVALVVAGISGFGGASYDVLERGGRLRPTAILAVLEGDGESSALEVARVGAIELLPRPPRPERLRALALRALAQHRILVEIQRLRASAPPAEATDRLVGRSEAIARVRIELQRLATSSSPVLLVGERGSGRAQAARVLRALSGIDTPLRILEGGKALGASGGIAFAPEIDRWEWAAQEELAGSNGNAEGVRLIASTTLDPVRAVEDGQLHPALFAVFEAEVIRIPALRDRREDVALLARAFVESLRQLNGLPPIALEPAAITALERHAWPGNVKELRDAVETAMILAADGVVRAGDFPESIRGAAGEAAGIRADRRFRAAKRSVVDAFERSYLSDLLSRHGGNVTGAAEHSGMLRSALQRLLRKHDLRSSDFRAPGRGRSPDDAA